MKRIVLLILATAVSGAVLGVAIAFQLPPLWQASFLLQVGAVPGTYASGQGSLGPMTPIEAPHRVVERMRSEDFFKRLLQGSKLDVDVTGVPFALLETYLVPRVSDRPGLVAVTLRAPSTDLAQKWAELAVELVQQDHQRLSAQAYDRLRTYRATTSAELSEALRNREQSEEALRKTLGRNDAVASVIASSSVLNTRDTAITRLREQLFAIDDQLNPPKNAPTGFFQPVEISSRPVAPNKWLWLFSGSVLGSFAGALAAYLDRKSVV